MEKSIHTHLFDSAASLREHRLMHFASPEQQQFDEAAAKIEAAIEDPAQGAEGPTLEMAQLRILAINHSLTGEDRVNQLQAVLDTKTDLLDQLRTAEGKTADGNADWKKIQDGFNSSDATEKQKAVDAARALIAKSRTAIADLSGTIDLDDPQAKLLAKTTVKLIAAHNKNIENVQALDPSNTVELVTPRTGGQDAKDRLEEITEDGNDFIKDELDDLLNEYKSKVSDDAKALALKDIDAAIKGRRKEIYAEMNDVASHTPPYVNVEKMIGDLLSQLKRMKDARDQVVGTAQPGVAGPVGETGPSGVPSAAPATTPAENPDDVLEDVAQDKVSALVTAKTETEFKTALAALNSESAVQTDTVDIAAALNTKLTAFKVKANGTVLEIDTSAPAAPAATKDVNEKVTELRQMIEILKEFLQWLFQQNGVVKPGNDVASMRTRIASMKAEEDKLGTDPKFGDDPEMSRKADELQQQRIELETQLAAAEARNNRTARALQDQNTSDSLAVDQDGGLGNGGTPRLTQSPGASRRESVADMDAIVNGLPPELRRCVKKIESNNQVVLVFTGDINIDQRRIIKIKGDNNTVSDSQNGDDLASGVAMQGNPVNSIDGAVVPPPVEQFSPMPPPPRGDLEPAPMPVPPAPAEMPETPFDAESPTQPAPSGDLEEDVPGQE